MLCFAGGAPAKPGATASLRNRVYESIDLERIDGLILSAGTLESGVGAEVLAGFAERFSSLPRVSVGVPLPGVPSIVLDNADGTRRLVTHLVEAHGRRNVAFVRGPIANDEAEARFEGYRQALEAAGIDFEPALAVVGDFLQVSGERAVHALLASGRDFDAVVAANDEMALGALMALRARGIRVPEDCAVVGFDDGPAARQALPGLTTARQAVQEQAAAAVACVLAQVRGEAATERVELKTEIVMRRSCGCPLDQREFVVDPPRRPDSAAEESPLMQKRAELVSEALAAAPGLVSEEAAWALVDAFVAGVRGKGTVAFATVWDDLLVEAERADADLRRFQSVITALRRGAVPPLIELGGLLIRAETMLHEARVLLANQIHHRESQRHLADLRAMHGLADLAEGLILCSDLDALLRTVGGALPTMGIPRAYLALHETPEDERRGDVALVLALTPEGPRSLSDERRRFPTADLLGHLLTPDAPRAFLVTPLCFGERSLGVAVFEMGSADGSLYEALRASICAGLEAVNIAGRRRESAKLRHDLLGRATTLVATLERALNALGVSQPPRDAMTSAPPSSDEISSVVGELSDLVDGWSSFVGQERDTLRAPGAPTGARALAKLERVRH